MIATTAMYIGFRTNRYGPTTTRCCVGAMGAGVPDARAKRTNASSSSYTPGAIRSNATTQISTGGPHAAGSRHPLISHGTSPATTPGATTRNRIVPAHERTEPRDRSGIGGYRLISTSTTHAVVTEMAIDSSIPMPSTGMVAAEPASASTAPTTNSTAGTSEIPDRSNALPTEN